MSAFLFLALIVLGALLFDTRRRLSRAENALAGLHEDVHATSYARCEAIPEPVPAPVPAAELAPEPAEPEPASAPAPARAKARVVHDLPEAAVTGEREAGAGEEAKPTAFNFEDLFGRKLPIWAGGITLLVAAVFLVRYSIDSGLLSPLVRVSLGLLFGAGLIAGGEVARRKADRIQDPRVAQALAGAGIGALYAATLAAANLYALVGPVTAFLGLAAITVGAGLLSTRFGAPSALLGLVGGLATPALIQSEQPDMALLAVYIAALVGGLTLLSRRQRWAWLGISALVGGAGWSLVMIATGALDALSTLATGSLVMLLGLGFPMLVKAPRDTGLVRMMAAGIAALQLALLVATGGFTLLTWGLYGVLAIAFLALVRTLVVPQTLTLVPLVTALALLFFWDEPAARDFALVVCGLVAIFGGHAIYRLGAAASRREALGLGLLSVVTYAALAWHFDLDTGPGALSALGLAGLSAAGGARIWRGAREQAGQGFAWLGVVAAALVLAALVPFAPAWSLAMVYAALVAALVVLARAAKNRWLHWGAGLYQLGGVLALVAEGNVGAEFSRLVTDQAGADTLQALVRWGSLMLSAGLLAWSTRGQRLGQAAQILTALLGYGTLAQIVPALWLASTCALVAALALVFTGRNERTGLAPAVLTLGALAALWALAPLGSWLEAAGLSLIGVPVLVADLPPPMVALARMLLPALLLCLALVRGGIRFEKRAVLLASSALGTVAVAGLHVLYKQLFGLAGRPDFVAYGLAERTIWEAALLALGFACWKLARRPLPAALLAGAGLAHLVFYTLGLHDPLWSDQAVGPWPMANFVLAAFAVAWAGTVLLGGAVRGIVPAPVEERWLARARDFVRMPVLVLFPYALVRQLCVGSRFAGVAPGPAENIAWSVLAIALAIGFLLWGIRKGVRSWRVASLVLMLGAVGKVFVFDASGLEGLVRIASFLALGFSLIGIGWLYSRTLKVGSGQPSVRTSMSEEE